MKLSNKAFKNLTDKQKDVWVPVMQECVTEYETARRLGISRDAVHDRLNKARRRYKRYIKSVLENK